MIDLSFSSKFIEKLISLRILGHILDNNIVYSFSLLIGQATVVRRFYFVCSMILSQLLEKAMDNFLVLLDVSAAFDTIEHVNLFYILEKVCCVGTTWLSSGSNLFVFASTWCDT